MNKMVEMIDDIERYIDSCKFQPLSKTNIIVDKTVIDGMLQSLREKTPDEVRQYQTVINNKEAILTDARERAHALINEAETHRNELINEHEVMRQAYEQANEVVKSAAEQADELLQNATAESNEMRIAAVAYTDQLLQEVENILQGAMDNTSDHLNALLSNFASYYETVRTNRLQLIPPEPLPAPGEETLSDDTAN